MTVQPESTPEPTPTPEPAPPELAPEPKKPDPIAEQRRRANAEKRRADSLQKQIDDAERVKAEEEGRHRELAETERKRAEAAEAQLQRINAERTVERIASQPVFTDESLRFVNPDEALALLPEGTDTTSPESVTTALHALAVQRPHLLSRPAMSAPAVVPPSGGPTPPPSSEPPKLTREQVQAMSPSDVAALLSDPARREEVLALNLAS